MDLISRTEILKKEKRYFIITALLVIFNSIELIVFYLSPLAFTGILEQLAIMIEYLTVFYFVLGFPWVTGAALLLCLIRAVIIACKTRSFHKAHLIYAGIAVLLAIQLYIWYPIAVRAVSQ